MSSLIVAFARSIIPLDCGFDVSLNICILPFFSKKSLNASLTNSLPLSIRTASILDFYISS